MNVLRQNLSKRVLAIVAITLLFSAAMYSLEFSAWAETIRQAVFSEESPENLLSRSYAVMLGGSLLKAGILIGVPLLITRLVNRAIQFAKSRKHLNQ